MIDRAHAQRVRSKVARASSPLLPLALATTLLLASMGSAAARGPKTEPKPRKPAPAKTSKPAPAKTSKPAPAKPTAKKRYVVAVMGDSLSDPKSHGGKYLDVLRKRCPNSRFDTYGVGGNMVNQMRRRFLRDVFGEGKASGKRPPYTHVMILGGINDICSDESANRRNDKIEADLGWMYDASKARGAEVVAMTLPPWAGFTRYYNARRGRSTLRINAWITDQKKAGRIDRLLDVYPLLSCGRPAFLCKRYGWRDQVHWNAVGHRVVGVALHERVFSDCQ